MNAVPQGRRRVVITGMGMITPLGSEVEAIWQALLEGRSGIRGITQFDPKDLPCRIAGEVPEFHPEEFIPAKEARRLARCSQMALVAAHKALADAHLPHPFAAPERVGVYFGTAMGGFERADEGLKVLRTQGLSRVSPFSIPSAIPNMPAFQITQAFGALGPNITITTACATGTQTVGEAAHAIRHDRADVILEDFEGRYVAVEVEEAVTIDNIVGVLQAIKYRYMYAAKCHRRNEEVRAFLVAHEIDKETITFCSRYGVECFKVPRR